MSTFLTQAPVLSEPLSRVFVRIHIAKKKNAPSCVSLMDAFVPTRSVACLSEKSLLFFFLLHGPFLLAPYARDCISSRAGQISDPHLMT